MTICDRCGEETRMITGSYFNTEMICLKCDKLERTHPAFEEARRIESEHVDRGDYNFGGVGSPGDLR